MSMGDDYLPAEPHGELTEAFPGVFLVTGRLALRWGHATRNMVVLRDGGELTVVNSVRLTPAGEARLEALGAVRHVIKLGAFHDRDDPWYKHRFGAQVWAFPKARHSRGLSTDHEIVEAGELPVPGAELFRFRGARHPEGALLLPGGVLLTTDSVQHHPDTEGCSPIARIAMNLMGFRRAPAVVGPPWRKAMSAGGGNLRADFERLAALDFQHLIGAHGKPLRDTAREAVAALARSF